MNASTLWLSCGVLRAELEALHQRGQIGGELRFLDSMLHMCPPQLETVLTERLLQAEPGRLVLVYGDCCPRMLDLVRRFRVGRVDAINCAQLLVGRLRYRELMRAEAFLLLPEWTQRWREIFRDELGLSAAVAPDFMREHRRELVYLDLGLSAVPRQTLDECAAFTGLPWRVESVPLDHLLVALHVAEAVADPPTTQEATP